MFSANDGAQSDMFGYSVAMSDNNFITGARMKECLGSLYTGAAYIFNNTSYVNQEINLSAGWNVVSFNVPPQNMAMESIFQPLINQNILEIIQDDHTGTLWPAYNINTIGQMSINEGYKVKITENATLTLDGSSVPLPVILTFDEGWNTIGYPSGQE